MATYLVETRKATQALGGRKWSNRYFVSAASMTEALDAAEVIWQQGERLFHFSDVYCYEVYANLQGDVPFSVGGDKPIPASIAFGALNGAALGDLMPTFCTVRVDFSVAGSRPSRKFYRPMLREGLVTGDQLTSGTVLISGLSTGLANITGPTILDPDGQEWSSGNHTIMGLSSRRLGRNSFVSVPPPPTEPL